MRLTFLLFVGALCVAFSFATGLNDNTVQDDKAFELLNLADQGESHANEGTREVRAFFGGGGYCCRGYGYGYGYGRGGYRRGGYRRGYYGRRRYGYWG